MVAVCVVVHHMSLFCVSFAPENSSWTHACTSFHCQPAGSWAYTLLQSCVQTSFWQRAAVQLGKHRSVNDVCPRSVKVKEGARGEVVWAGIANSFCRNHSCPHAPDFSLDPRELNAPGDRVASGGWTVSALMALFSHSNSHSHSLRKAIASIVWLSTVVAMLLLLTMRLCGLPLGNAHSFPCCPRWRWLPSSSQMLHICSDSSCLWTSLERCRWSPTSLTC